MAAMRLLQIGAFAWLAFRTHRGHVFEASD